MRVRVINRRQNATVLQSSHDNIFSDVSDLSAPRGIPADVKLLDSAQVLRPAAFNLASKKKVDKTSPDQHRGVPCFDAQAVVITQFGAKPICDLTSGDRVLTRDNGFQSILWVGAPSSSDAVPMTIEIEPDAVMDGKPDKVIRVSGRQSVLLTCPEIQSQFGSAEVLARAGDLQHLRGFSVVETEGDFVAVLMERHELLNVNGLWMDSMIPDSEALDCLLKSDRKSIQQALPKIGALPIDRTYPSARVLLRAEFARQFAR